MTPIGAFAREFLRSPVNTASLLPSLGPLCRQAIAPLPAHGDPVVVDLGAGTGAVTDEVVTALGGRGRHVAVELNERMAAGLARRHPGVEVRCVDAATAVAELVAEGVRADLVVSGLPWPATTGTGSIFPSLTGLLAPGGAVTQLQHAWVRVLPTAQQVRRNLEAAFEEVLTTRTVWLNPPPAVVYVARRPRPEVLARAAR